MTTRATLLLAILLAAAAAFQACSSDTAAPIDEGGDAGAAADAGGKADAGDQGDAGGEADAGAPADAGFAEVPGTKAFFTVPYPVDEARFFNLPFPSDLRLKADGTLDLAGFPSGDGTITDYITLIAENAKGWATQGAAFFKFDAALDVGSLPAEGDTMAATSPIFLVNVDGASAGKGTLYPLTFRFSAAALQYGTKNLLTILPESGFPLDAGTRYAVVITRAVKGADGKALGSRAAFEATKSAAPLDDADLEKARALHAPVYDYLETLGVARADVAAMTVFTTQDPYGELRRMRDWLQDDANLPAPAPKGLKYAESKAGFDIYTGTYTCLKFQSGAPPYDAKGTGGFVFDQNGDPVPQGEMDVRFALAVPTGAAPAGGWPIVQYVHGTGGDYYSFIDDGTAGELAGEKLASISFDQPLHGDGAAGGRNTGNWNVDFETFNVGNLIAMRDNFRQSALDSVVLLRMTRALTVPASVAKGGAAIAFNPAKTYFFGHSQGGLTGPLFVSVEPGIPAALFSEGGGRFVISILEKTQPVDIPKALKALLATNDPLDLYHPALNLLQIGAEPTDPANYAVHLVRRPPGASPVHVFFTEGTKDPYTPPDAINALATAAYVQLSKSPYSQDVPQLDLRWAGLGGAAIAENPISENCTPEDGKKATGALVMFKDEGHFAVFDNATAKAMFRHFFRTMVDTGVPVITVP